MWASEEGLKQLIKERLGTGWGFMKKTCVPG